MMEPQVFEKYGVRACVNCDRCRDVCPIRLEDERFSPSRLVKTTLTGRWLERDDFTLVNCLGCRACKVRCPSEDVEFGKFVRIMRAETFDGGGYEWTAHGGALHHLEAIDPEPEVESSRLDSIPEEFKSIDGDEVLFVGCLPYFDIFFRKDPGVHPMQTVISALALLKAAGSKPRLLPDEPCCGHDLHEIGDKKAFSRKAEAVMFFLRRARAQTVFTVCPECAYTISELYPEYGIFPGVNVVPVVDFLSERIGRLAFRNRDEKVSLLESCRGFGSRKKFRKVLGAVPGLQLKETAPEQEYPSCCGTSGFFACGKIASRIALKRLKEAEAAGAGTLLSGCPKATIHLSCAVRKGSWVESRTRVEDFLTFIASALKSGGRQ